MEDNVNLARVMAFGTRFFEELNDAEQSTFLGLVMPFFDFESNEAEVEEEDDDPYSDDDADLEAPDDVSAEVELDDEEVDACAPVPASATTRAGAKRPKRSVRPPHPKGSRPAKYPRDATAIRERLLKLFRAGEELSPKQAVERLGRSPWAVRQVLWKMFDDHEVERTGKTNSTRYRLLAEPRG